MFLLQNSTPFIQDWHPTSGFGDFQSANNWEGDRSVNKYPGDDIHVDMIGIPGGTVRILHHAFMAEFGSSSIPIDIDELSFSIFEFRAYQNLAEFFRHLSLHF